MGKFYFICTKNSTFPHFWFNFLFPPLFKIIPVPSLFFGSNETVPRTHPPPKYAPRIARTHDLVPHLPFLSSSLSSRRSNLAYLILFITLDPSAPSVENVRPQQSDRPDDRHGRQHSGGEPRHEYAGEHRQPW